MRDRPFARTYLELLEQVKRCERITHTAQMELRRAAHALTWIADHSTEPEIQRVAARWRVPEPIGA